MLSRKKYFNQLLETLNIEELEDKIQNDISIDVASLAEKVESGKCWYPISLLSISAYDDSEYILRFRKSNFDIYGQAFNIGKPVQIFNNGSFSSETHNLRGVIDKIKNYEVSVRVDAREVEDFRSSSSWLNQGDLAIEIIYSRTGYKKMRKAIRRITTNPDSHTKLLSDILTGLSEPSEINHEDFSGKVDMTQINSLNESQQKAIENIISSKDVVLVHGPPGTGKTTTIVNAIKLLVSSKLVKGKILVTAPSNTAVDVIASRLHQIGGMDVLRLGNPDKIDVSSQATCIASRMKTHENYLLLDHLNKSIHKRNSYLKNSKICKEDKNKLKERNVIDRKVRNKIRKQIVKDLIGSAQVIACTLEHSVSQELRVHKHKFEYAFIDEAGQAIEPLCWLPICQSKRVVMIGDHKQLPPVVKSVKTNQNGLQKSLFEKAIDNGNVKHNLLNIQYRMNEKIMSFPNYYFYNNELDSAPKNRLHTVFNSSINNRWNNAVEFIDTSKLNFSEDKLSEISSRSILNKAEGTFLIKHLENLLVKLEEHNVDNDSLSIGVVTPYRRQSEYLNELIDSSQIVAESNFKIKNNTIDGFQGQEQDIIYISLVRSNETQEIGFLSEYRRMNVAMTRARKKLILIGDVNTLSSDDFYVQLIDFVRKENSFFDASSMVAEQQLV